MPQLATKYFGAIDYRQDAVLEFPNGMPGFEDEHRFLPLELPPSAPLVFLQSLDRPELRFITLPVLSVDPGYQLQISTEDLLALGLPEEHQPDLRAEVLCLVIIRVSEDRTPTVNLLAPIVINLATRRAVQSIRTDSEYSHQHPLIPVPKEESCS